MESRSPQPGASSSSSTTPPRAARPHSGSSAHVASGDVLADAALRIAQTVEAAVFDDQRRADRSLAIELRERRDLALPDHRFVSEATMALLRWRGWVEQIGFATPEERMLMAWMLDADAIHPICRIWSRRIGRDPGDLMALGTAPDWPARSQSIKRWLGDRASRLTADPWRLFPPWLREVLPIPPGDEAIKTRFVGLLQAFQQRPPLWVRARRSEAEAVWRELGQSGVKPWTHRRVPEAAKAPTNSDLPHHPAFLNGLLEIQDLASQAVGLVCDPKPGQRWWDACAGAGGKTLHLADLMGGKGLVIASDIVQGKLVETVRRARRAGCSNVSTKLWDGRKPPGKSASFHGVLVDAPCSGLGTWRRNPDARWTIQRAAVARLAKIQGEILRTAAPAVRLGGHLIYSACTLTIAETREVIESFLKDHPQFRLEPFRHPLQEGQCDGMLWIWPQDADSDAMFIARMVRS